MQGVRVGFHTRSWPYISEEPGSRANRSSADAEGAPGVELAQAQRLGDAHPEIEAERAQVEQKQQPAHPALPKHPIIPRPTPMSSLGHPT